MTGESPQELPSADDHDAFRAYCEHHGQPYVPGFVQRMPLWSPEVAVCPCCFYVYSEPPVPSRSQPCVACGDTFWIRACPDGVRRSLNETAMIEVECLNAEQGTYLDTVSIGVGSGIQIGEAREEARVVLRRIARGRVLAKHGRGPWIGDDGLPVES